MQYIEKANVAPLDWDFWFTTGAGLRSFDYGTDQQALVSLPLAKAFLLHEQSGLCAYCQSALTEAQASIEHVVPKTHNQPLSTNYFNLVAVCKSPSKDSVNGRLHCDKERGDRLMPVLIFYKNCQVSLEANHPFFDVYTDGQVVTKPKLPAETAKQIDAFIDVLHLNSSILKARRSKDVLMGILEVFAQIPHHRKRDFWQAKFNSVYRNMGHPYRQFLLIYISKQLGRN
jgi:uncharacterized protein (TIGR02646 family)